MSRIKNLRKYMSSSVKIKGLYVSTEAFRHDTVLFLTGGPVPPWQKLIYWEGISNFSK